MTRDPSRYGAVLPSTASSPSTLCAEDFEYVRRLLREEAGIAVDGSRAYFVEARLEALAAREGHTSTTEWVDRLRLENSDELRTRTVEALSPNETSFFRDARPFEQVHRSVLPDLIARRLKARRLRIWSAACSSGQEPYSLALLLLEQFPGLDDWDVSILASDLSTEMVRRGRLGRYTQAEVNRGLPASLLVKHFRREGLDWTIGQPARRRVEFRPINLIDDWPAMEPVDLVALRNVLIYFGIDDRKAILAGVARIIAPDGYLWLGATESTINLDDRFQRLEPERGSLYRLRPR